MLQNFTLNLAVSLRKGVFNSFRLGKFYLNFVAVAPLEIPPFKFKFYRRAA